MVQKNKVVLITGAARRVGAAMAEFFHQQNYRVIIHYRNSQAEAHRLAQKLNRRRDHSAICIAANLDDANDYEKLIDEAYRAWKRLDVLINNASTFFPTPLNTLRLSEWDRLMNSNLKAPLFLSHYAAPYLHQHKGSIINITDIHAQSPKKNYSIYSCAKAGLALLTKSLALELAPAIRVNAIAPGCVIWPEGVNRMTVADQKKILSNTLLQKQVRPVEIAQTALFLAQNDAITGQTIVVDAGN